MLITDRDLLALDPTVFLPTGAAGIATVLHASSDAAVSGSTLTSASADFAARGIDEGHVAVVNGAAVEILGRTSGTVLEISLPRPGEDDPAILPGDGSGLSLTVLSLARLIAQHQSALLAELGLGPAGNPWSLDETALVNADAVGVVLGQRIVREAFAQAAARDPTDASLQARADLWSRSLGRAEASLVALIDVDGDGLADILRHLRVPRFVRV